VSHTRRVYATAFGRERLSSYQSAWASYAAITAMNRSYGEAAAAVGLPLGGQSAGGSEQLDPVFDEQALCRQGCHAFDQGLEPRGR
jgi:hypothetical protein